MAKIIATGSEHPKEAEAKNIAEKLGKRKRSKSVAKHFGALKRGIDGLGYQKQQRNEW